MLIDRAVPLQRNITEMYTEKKNKGAIPIIELGYIENEDMR